jgi:hypothetical protein
MTKEKMKQTKTKKINGTLVKSSVVKQKPGFMYFVRGGDVYELKVTGLLKAKDQDICFTVDEHKEEKIKTGVEAGSTDPVGFHATNRALVVGVRSQLSSVAKNFDTLVERAFAETLNLREHSGPEHDVQRENHPYRLFLLTRRGSFSKRLCECILVRTWLPFNCFSIVEDGELFRCHPNTVVFFARKEFNVDTPLRSCHWFGGFVGNLHHRDTHTLGVNVLCKYVHHLCRVLSRIAHNRFKLLASLLSLAGNGVSFHGHLADGQLTVLQGRKQGIFLFDELG